MRWTALLVVLPLFLPAVTAAENWPHWRGPHWDGTTDESHLPTTWSFGEAGRKNVRWRVDLPGPAGSTPIVWGDRIFVTSTDTESKNLWVVAFDRQGKPLWKVAPDRGSVDVFAQFAHETNAAAPSPVTDGEHLWVLFGTSKLFRLDMSGQVTWTVDLAERYGPPKTYFGLSASPLLHGDHLYLQLLHSDAQLVVALDKATGKEVWQHQRATDASQECLHSYASVMPFLGSKDAGGQLLVHGADYITSHRFTDGAEVWRYGTLNPKDGYNASLRLVSTPVSSAGGLVIVPTAKRGPVFGLRPAAKTADASPMGLSWKLDKGTPDVPSPIIADGLVYLAGENGRLTVVDGKNGKTLYAERVHQSQHRGSPVLADDKLFLTATDGTVSVIKPGRTFELLAKNSIEAERLAASPAISNGTIYLRTYEALFAIGELGEEPKKPAAAAGSR